MIDPTNKEFRILICLIEIWDDDGSNSRPIYAITDKITEVESVEISESFAQVVDTAKVKFPKGTILRQTMTQSDDDPVVQFDSNLMISYVKAGARIAGVADFSVGRRIAIRFGYTDDPSIVKLSNAAEKTNIFNNENAYDDYCAEMNYRFLGYITQCSTEEPIELKCENLGYNLKSVMVPDVGSMDDITVNYLFSPDGDSSLPEPRNTEKPNLLDGTGLTLHPDVTALKLSAGKFTPDRSISVDELLTSWSKKLLHSFVVNDKDNDKDYLIVSQSYFSTNGYDSVAKMAQIGRNQGGIIIDFSIDVANNGLTLTRIDQYKLAVKGTGRDKDGKLMHVIVTLIPPEEVAKGKEPLRVLKAANISKKKSKKGTPTNRVDLSKYTVLQYQSDKIYEEKDEKQDDGRFIKRSPEYWLEQDAGIYLVNYNKTGLDGTLTLFGDYGSNDLYSGCTVWLKDERHQAKQGLYVVGEIITRFGVKGYRRIIKLPYCLKLGLPAETE